MNFRVNPGAGSAAFPPPPGAQGPEGTARPRGWRRRLPAAPGQGCLRTERTRRGAGSVPGGFRPSDPRPGAQPSANPALRASPLRKRPGQPCPERSLPPPEGLLLPEKSPRPAAIGGHVGRTAAPGLRMRTPPPTGTSACRLPRSCRRPAGRRRASPPSLAPRW